jgi:hypothetical protein
MGAWVFHGEPMVISAGGSVPGSVSSIGYVPEIDMAYVFLLNSDYLLEDLRFDHFAGDILAILGHDIGELQRAQDDVETEIAPAVDAQYAVGDEITLPAVPVSVNLLDKPGEGGAPFGACFGGGVAIIVQTGNVDNMNWYKVDCTGLQGWLPAEALEQ